MKKLHVVLVISVALALTNARCNADTPDEAVAKAVGANGHAPQQADTDIDGDGYTVMPVTVNQPSGKLQVTGEILHTYNFRGSTEIKYDVTINSDGTVSGTLSIPRPNNPDNFVIKNDMSGTVRGSVNSVQRDILPSQSKMDHAMILIQKVLALERSNHH